MDFLSLLLRRSGSREHVAVFEEFRRVIGALIADHHGRAGTRAAHPFDWLNR